MGRYGITLDRYNEMLETQGGVCAMCGEPETAVHNKSDKVMALAVNHDHACCPGSGSCGECVRGLLCRRCNFDLGGYEAIRDAAELYLRGV
jgi:hypothetical protein